MTRRHRHHPDDPEYRRSVERASDLPLFATPTDLAPSPPDNTAAVQAGTQALEQAAAGRSREIAALVPLARQLARQAGAQGITVSDLRRVAEGMDLLSREARGRSLSWLGAVMQRAGLVPTGEYRRSTVVKSHANLHAVFRAPDRRESAPGAA